VRGAAAAGRGGGGRVHPHGRPVQVDAIKPTLKAPGTKRLKLRCDVLLSTSAFKFKLRRYTMEDEDDDMIPPRQHDGDTTVGRCRLTLSNPS